MPETPEFEIGNEVWRDITSGPAITSREFIIECLRDAAALAERIDAANEDGGLHVVVADGNVDEETIQFCIDQTDKPLTPDEQVLAEDMLQNYPAINHLAYFLTYNPEWLAAMKEIVGELEKKDA